MDNIPLPTEVFLHLVTSDNGGQYAVMTATDLSSVKGYKLLDRRPIDYSGVKFDRVEAEIEALTARMGEAQAQVNACKERIANLTCIGHETPHTADVTVGPDGRIVKPNGCKFPEFCNCPDCDDIPF